MEQPKLEGLKAEFIAVRNLPEVKIQLKDEVKIFNATTSLPDAIRYLVEVYAQEDYYLRQFSIKITKDKDDVPSVAINTLLRNAKD